MRRKRYLFWTSALALLGGAAALLRPAALRGVSMTALTPGTPSTASVALSYGAGALPVSVIVDVYDQNGDGGSATIAGDQLFVEVPIMGSFGGEYRLTATATYRLLGLPWTRVREFAGSQLRLAELR